MTKFKKYVDVNPIELDGTLEYVDGRALVSYVEDPDDPWDIETPRMRYDGETKVFWGGQTCVTMDDGRPVFLTHDGTAVVVEPDGRVAEVSVEIKATAEYVTAPHSSLFSRVVEEVAGMSDHEEREAALVEVKRFIDTYLDDISKEQP